MGRKFIILNENVEVFCGLLKGYPNFSPNWKDAKLLYNMNQFQMVRWGTSYSLEIHYLD